MPLILSCTGHVYPEGRVEALNDVSITVNKGEIILLAGRNGSGKSTLLHALAGTLRPSVGRVVRDGTVALAVQYPERALIGRTVFDDIAFGPKNRGEAGESLRAIVMDTISSLGIDEDVLSTDPRELSHGQKRLVALAGIFAMKPSYLLLDEPLAGLDRRGRKAVLDAIAAAGARGSGVVFTSHDIAVLSKICTRMVIMDKGLIVMDCAPRAMKSSSCSIPGVALPDSLALARKLEQKGIDTGDAWTPEELAMCVDSHYKKGVSR